MVAGCINYDIRFGYMGIENVRKKCVIFPSFTL